jgi:hypothetical protein
VPHTPCVTLARAATFIVGICPIRAASHPSSDASAAHCLHCLHCQTATHSATAHATLRTHTPHPCLPTTTLLQWPEVQNPIHITHFGYHIKGPVENEWFKKHWDCFDVHKDIVAAPHDAGNLPALGAHWPSPLGDFLRNKTYLMMYSGWVDKDVSRGGRGQDCQPGCCLPDWLEFLLYTPGLVQRVTRQHVMSAACRRACCRSLTCFLLKISRRLSTHTGAEQK